MFMPAHGTVYIQIKKVKVFISSLSDTQVFNTVDYDVKKQLMIINDYI